MTAYQSKVAAEVARERRARNPILATESYGTRQDELMGSALVLTCQAREDGRYLVQLRSGSGVGTFQNFYTTIEAARDGWRKARKIARETVARTAEDHARARARVAEHARNCR